MKGEGEGKVKVKVKVKKLKGEREKCLGKFFLGTRYAAKSVDHPRSLI